MRGRYHKKIEYEIYTYYMMCNHIHLLIKEGREALSNSMKRIGTTHASCTTDRILKRAPIPERNKSESVEKDVTS